MFPNRYAEAVREFARKHDLRNRFVPAERADFSFWDEHPSAGGTCSARGPGLAHYAPFLTRGDATSICVYCLRVVFKR